MNAMLKSVLMQNNIIFQICTKIPKIICSEYLNLCFLSLYANG